MKTHSNKSTTQSKKELMDERGSIVLDLLALGGVLAMLATMSLVESSFLLSLIQ